MPPARCHGPSLRLVDSYCEGLTSLLGRSRKTAYTYGSVLETFVRFLEGSPVMSATPDTVEAFLVRPRVKRDGALPSPATQNHELTVLRGFYKWLVSQGRTQANPAALALAGGRPKVVERQPDPVEDHIWRKFLAECWPMLTDDEVSAIALAFYGGLRRSEIVDLRATQWDASQGKVVRFIRKGGGSNTLPFGECVSQLEEAHPDLFPPGGSQAILSTVSGLAQRRGGALLLPWPLLRGQIDPQTFNRRLRTILTAGGMDNEFHPHQMRHSFVTNMLRAGVPIDIVSDLAGHTNINMTMRYAKSGNQRFSSWRSQRQ